MTILSLSKIGIELKIIFHAIVALGKKDISDFFEFINFEKFR